MIHHDYYLGRTEDGEGYLGEFTLAELKQFDVGSWFGQAWLGERMPTLDEVLMCGKGRVRFEIEMRTPTHDCIKRVLESLVRHDVCEMVEITSPHLPILYQVKALNVPCRLGVFFEPCPDWMLPSLRQQHIISWMILSQAHVAHIPESLIEASFVSALQDEGFLVHGADLNTNAGIQHGLQAGIDQFSTDTLELALQHRKEYL